MPTDFYDVLGAPADASSDELKRAYRSRVREYHPDVNDHPEGDAQFKLIRRANDVLTDSAERKDYDRMGHREYANKRLDDLPPFSVFPEFEDAAGESPEETDRPSTGTSSTATSKGQNTTTTSATSTESGRNRRRNQAGQSSSSSGSTTDSTTTDRSRASRATASTTDSTDEATASETNAGAETSASSEWADLSGEAATRTADKSSTPAGVRRRRGLRRWYGVVLVALLAYAGGLSGYILANREGARSLVGELQTAPVPTLVEPFPLQSPTAAVVTAVETAVAGTPGLGLVFLVGSVLLPLVVLTAVAQYGHGSAWAYALASLGPAVTLVAYPFVMLPVAVLLVGMVVLPLVSGLGFLVDVGRYLLATR
jgi:curved DNA-binding protein CbpA